MHRTPNAEHTETRAMRETNQNMNLFKFKIKTYIKNL